MLAPAYTDERTGYRWYHPEEIATGVLVRTPRQLDVPLASVAAFLSTRTRPRSWPASRGTGRRWSSLATGRTTRDHMA